MFSIIRYQIFYLKNSLKHRQLLFDIGQFSLKLCTTHVMCVKIFEISSRLGPSKVQNCFQMTVADKKRAVWGQLLVLVYISCDGQKLENCGSHVLQTVGSIHEFHDLEMKSLYFFKFILFRYSGNYVILKFKMDSNIFGGRNCLWQISRSLY